ncbi:MAG: acyl carrier protein [Luteimonas sp.]|nr:acyl carrier protein [Luteimonas sp.]
MHQAIDQRAHRERTALALLRFGSRIAMVGGRRFDPGPAVLVGLGRAGGERERAGEDARDRHDGMAAEGCPVLGHNRVLFVWRYRTDMTRRQQIKQFILGNFLFTDDDNALADDTSLIQQGIVDSTGILELIGFIEETWHVQVPAQDMTPANFDSLGSIDRYLDGRLAG